MQRVSRLLLFTVPQAHRHQRPNLKCCLRPSAGRLERSDIVFEFLAIMRSAPILPLLLRPVQHLLVRAAIDLTPRWLQTILGLNGHGVRRWEVELIRQAGAFADRLVLETNPAVQACLRVRLPAQYLYVHRGRQPSNRT